MKHKLSITLLLLGMFLVTQLVGLFVVSVIGDALPFGLETPETTGTTSIFSIVFSFLFAFAIIFFLMKYRWKIVIKVWFSLVVTLAISISIFAILTYFFPDGIFSNLEILAIAIGLPLALLKILKTNRYTHNLTELLIYPGIATVFIPILNPTSAIVLLILISFYDMWAVWKSGIMQKMAKFQMEEVKIFGGFMIPSMSQKTRLELNRIKGKYKGKKIPKTVQEKKYKVNLAILGGGDVVFPIITSGVFLKYYGIVAALFVMMGAFVGLSFLFWQTKKGKAYPAMPYISSGIFLSLFIWIILRII